MTLCYEELSTKLEISSEKLNFTLTGMTGSQKSRESRCRHNGRIYGWIDFSCARKFRSVRNVPISEGCIPRREDLEN